MALRATFVGIAGAILVGTVASAQTILVGLGSPSTGPAAAPAVWQRWGVDIAVDEINAKGGVLGRKVEVRAYDNRCNPSEAVNAANRLVEDKVVAILGMHCSSATLAAMPIVAQAGVPLIEGIASSPKITDLSGAGGNDWTFRINPSDQDMMDALGIYLSKNSALKKFALLGEDTDFGRGGAAAFANVARQDGLEIISTDFHPQNLADFTPLLTRIRQSRPDAIALFQLAGDQANLLRNAMQLGLHIPYAGRFDPGGNNATIIAAGGMENSITAWTYSTAIDTPANKYLVGETEKRFKAQPLLQTWAGYDTMRLVAQAIQEAGSAEPAKIRDVLKKIKFTNAMGQQVAFDDHNQGGRTVLIEKIADKKVEVEKVIQLGK